MKNIQKYILASLLALLFSLQVSASSHREAPLIGYDPLADNTDVYAFRSPDDPSKVTIIALYVPTQLPQGGPNYYQFGQNVRYEIHIDNDASIYGDEITYRFTFHITNEDPTTFFNIRLGAQNLKTTYTCERLFGDCNSGSVILAQGIVPPNNIGARSIESPLGLGTPYSTLMQNAIMTGANGEKIFCGPVDDPFFVDLGGVFDLADAPRQNGTPVDGLKCYNASAIAIQIPIEQVVKHHQPANLATGGILDPNYIIGVWASASRQRVRTLGYGTEDWDGEWAQVSRLGMPLTNEAVIPIGQKDRWNSSRPYEDLTNGYFNAYFWNPELALYMDDDLFGGAIPALAPLRIQRNALGAFDFGNGHNGLWPLKGSAAVAGTALDDAIFGNLLLPGPGKPRSVDFLPFFNTGVPNFPPYQLATGKGGNPLAPGKPFINNFLPTGDMLRINLAVPPTPRNSPHFSSLGIIAAAVAGLTQAPYNQTANLEFIPNMDGFPNGRRLEDDVTRIELQATAGVALAAIGLWYDDFVPGQSPVTPDLLGVLTYTTGVEANDAPFTAHFPYMAKPWAGDGPCGGTQANASSQALTFHEKDGESSTESAAPSFAMENYPNPFSAQTNLRYDVAEEGLISISVYDVSGKVIAQLVNEVKEEGSYSVDFSGRDLQAGVYFAKAANAKGEILQILKLVKTK